MHRKSRLIAILKLSNELEKREEMRGLPRILSLFRNKLNKFNNIGAQLLGSIYCMTIKLLLNCI